jgi:hypothetical protein
VLEQALLQAAKGCFVACLLCVLVQRGQREGLLCASRATPCTPPKNKETKTSPRTLAEAGEERLAVEVVLARVRVLRKVVEQHLQLERREAVEEVRWVWFVCLLLGFWFVERSRGASSPNTSRSTNRNTNRPPNSRDQKTHCVESCRSCSTLRCHTLPIVCMLFV